MQTLLEQGQLEQLAQDRGCSGFMSHHLLRQKLHSPSAQPAPALNGQATARDLTSVWIFLALFNFMVNYYIKVQPE